MVTFMKTKSIHPGNPLGNSSVAATHITLRHQWTGKCLTSGSQERKRMKGEEEGREGRKERKGRKKNLCFVAPATFHAVNTPTLAKFKLRLCRAGKRCTQL